MPKERALERVTVSDAIVSLCYAFCLCVRASAFIFVRMRVCVRMSSKEAAVLTHRRRQARQDQHQQAQHQQAQHQLQDRNQRLQTLITEPLDGVDLPILRSPEKSRNIALAREASNFSSEHVPTPVLFVYDMDQEMDAALVQLKELHRQGEHDLSHGDDVVYDDI